MSSITRKKIEPLSPLEVCDNAMVSSNYLIAFSNISGEAVTIDGDAWNLILKSAKAHLRGDCVPRP